LSCSCREPSPLVLFPAETWKQWPYAPTLEGQYIIKNLVVIAAGLLVGATVRGGSVIADPHAAQDDERKEAIQSRERRGCRRGVAPSRTIFRNCK
jgi:hypothetical protein